MGQCGCGDFAGMWRVQGPSKMTYVIGPYGGCEDCGTPAGFSVDLMTANDLQQWDAHKLPVLGGVADEHFGLPLLSVSLLHTKLVQALEREWPGSDGVDRELLIEAMDIGTLIRETVAETVAEFNKEAKKV
ncbi:MAG TPA: hypothetical protein VFF65_09425 [Phycisphaerales bacterium]|nr:hypothetical protein [Phycisphaerales bacterium]